MLGRNFSLIDTTLAYHSHFTPLKVLVLLFSMFSFLIRQVTCDFLHGLHLQYKRWEQWMGKEKTQRPIIPIDFTTFIMFTDLALNMPLILPPRILLYGVIRTLRPHGLPQSWAGWWTAEKQRQHLSGKSAVATLDSWEKHRDRVCSPSPQ